MTVETTIQQMFNEYPDLFPTRQSCYNHLFCVIGNGYEWRRGQIVSCDDEYEPEEEELDYAATHDRAKQSTENVLKYIERLREWRVFKPDRVPWNKEATDAAEWNEIDPEWYPICEYSLINNVPEDVKPDWKAAVEECKAMLRADGINI